MTEAPKEATTATSPKLPDSFRTILEGFKGKVVTVVNPESYEDAPIGHTLTTGFYRAKVVGLGSDFLVVASEYVHKGDKGKEPVRSYIPLHRVKRVSLMKNERLIHI